MFGLDGNIFPFAFLFFSSCKSFSEAQAINLLCMSVFAPLVNCKAKKRECRCVLADFFSSRTTEERVWSVRHGKISDDNG